MRLKTTCFAICSTAIAAMRGLQPRLFMPCIVNEFRLVLVQQLVAACKETLFATVSSDLEAFLGPYQDDVEIVFAELVGESKSVQVHASFVDKGTLD